MLAVALLPEFEAEAKERQRDHGGTAPGRPANTCGNSATSVEDDALVSVVDDLVEEIGEALGLDTGKSRDKAAAVVGVSPRMVSDAKAIQAEDSELSTAHHAQLIAGLTRAAPFEHTSPVKAAARKANSGASVPRAIKCQMSIKKTERVAVPVSGAPQMLKL